MAKIEIWTKETFRHDDIVGTLDEVVADMVGLSEVYGEDAVIEIYNDWEWSEYEIWFSRLETPSEEYQRERAIKLKLERAEKKVAKERAQYEKLKKMYGSV